MNLHDLLSLLSRWLHVLPAIALFGGLIWMRFVLTGGQGTSLFDSQDETRRRWAKIVMLSALLLLVSGLYNTAIKEMTYQLDMTYRGLIGIKILLALVVFYLTAVLSGRSQRAVRFRQREKHWQNVTLLLLLLIVLIGGYLKVCSTSFPLKDRRTDAAEQVATRMDRNTIACHQG